MYYVEKTKVLISGVVAMQLICVFVFHIWKKQIFSSGGSNVHFKEKLLNDLPILEQS